MKVPVGPVTVDMIEAGDRVCLRYAQGGVFEPQTLVVWSRLALASPGRVMLDVGAYTGLFAISAALMGCTVHAFEPMPRNAQRTALNILSNDVSEKVTLHPVALSDEDGSAVFRFNGSMALTSGGSLLAEKSSYRSVNVNVARLDSFAFDDVAAIKIDVERAETKVLCGAVQTLARWRPTIIAEALDDEQRDAILEAAPGYQLADMLDVRNMLLVPA